MITWGQARLTTSFPWHDGQYWMVFFIFGPLFFLPDNIKEADLNYFQPVF
jgi:hypothetical protein